jgi:anti-sigma regulatory factor (Ser/Thr protein kinase)
MTILYWFLAINFLILVIALIVKASRQHRPGGKTKTTATAGASRDPFSRQWTVQNNILGIGTACDNLRDFLESREVPIKDVFDLVAMLEEMLSFVLSSEFPEHKTCAIRIGAKLNKTTVTLELRYEGRGRNPLETPEIDLTKPLEEINLDGMDIHLLRHWADRLDYQCDGRQCIFTAEKDVPSGS